MAKKGESQKLTVTIKELADIKNQHKLGLVKDYPEAALRVSSLFSTPNLAQAFKTKESYRKLAEQFNISPVKNYRDYLKPLERIEDHLKKEYGYIAKAAEQFSSAERFSGIGMTQEKARIAALTKNVSALGYASELTKAASSLSKTSFMERIEEQKKAIERLTKISAPVATPTESYILHSSTLEVDKLIRKKNKERENREKALYENSEAQVEKLDIISQYMIQQVENLELQNKILNEQVINLKLQNDKAENQISKIETQNKIMQDQQDENRRTSNIALLTAIASIVFGVYFSYLIYQWQDASDNKNQKELIQTIKASSSDHKLIESMNKQVEATQKTNKLLKKLLSEPKKQIPQ